jgi:SAM-dependent methyltransferase
LAGTAEQTAALEDILADQERAWNARPLLRLLYRDWYGLIASKLAIGDGATVELGSGIGKFREVVPDVLLTDVEQTRWCDVVVDAESLPFESASVRNIVLFDVFHHLPRPARFFDEASRVLHSGGRIVILDPYCSPLSTIAYKLFHHERTDLASSAFGDDEEVASAPFASNQARATLAFYREIDEFGRRWPGLRIVERCRFALLLYPLSGGFAGRPLIPQALAGPAHVLERMLAPLAPLLAFRCLVVLERVEPTSDDRGRSRP